MINLSEGGNIKVGEHAAEPIHVTPKNREQVQHDVHHALSKIHDSFHKATGHHLFGADKKALNTGSAYSGSTKHLFNKSISHDEFAKHKPKVGDIDVQVPKDHKDAIAEHLKAGKKFGKYTVLGTKKSGTESHAVMQHENGGKHQFDFEGVDYHKHEPTHGEQMMHNSDWHDTQHGVKGAHHKQLLNAVGMDHHKFGPSIGLKSRTDEADPGTKDPKEITKKLFGDKADHAKAYSFHGLTDLVKNHIPKKHHQAIYDKFASSVNKNTDNGPALNHLKQHLHVKKDNLHEGILKSETHHTSVIPLVGFSPISHMGHAKDLGHAMSKLPGTKHIGISSKADSFTPKERTDILKRQWGHEGTHHHIVQSGGETVARAYHGLPAHGKKELHLLVGHDRKEFAHGLKHALENGKIKEMNGGKFDKIHIHHPEDTDRSHGLSGTNMRVAAKDGDHQTFKKHLGPMFSDKESKTIMGKVAHGINSGSLAVNRGPKKNKVLSEGPLSPIPVTPKFRRFHGNYCGPGNRGGEPTDALDLAAKKHDVGYHYTANSKNRDELRNKHDAALVRSTAKIAADTSHPKSLRTKASLVHRYFALKIHSQKPPGL